MPKTFSGPLTINASRGSYNVSPVTSLLQKVGFTSGYVVISDRYFESQIRSDRVIFVDALESEKTLHTVGQISERLARLGVTRSDRVLAVGGGIIQDLATLACSLYMRGINWDYAPTTLLGMVDSCVGGKSSINVGSTKNLMGNIYPPDEIFIDQTFLESLPREEVLGGVVEAFKILYCSGSTLLEEFLVLNPECESPEMVSLIWESLSCKKSFIEKDEFDRAERRLLNFGHTFGHALEVGSEHKMSHGLAVGYGMWCASAFAGIEEDSQLVGWLRGVDTELAARMASPVTVDLDLCRAAFERDKKHSATTYRLIVPGDNGVEIVEHSRDGEAADRIWATLRKVVGEAEWLTTS